MLKELHKRLSSESSTELSAVQKAAARNENVFESLMEACKVCSIGQITNALFEVGGQYRRNM